MGIADQKIVVSCEKEEEEKDGRHRSDPDGDDDVDDVVDNDVEEEEKGDEA